MGSLYGIGGETPHIHLSVRPTTSGPSVAEELSDLTISVRFACREQKKWRLRAPSGSPQPNSHDQARPAQSRSGYVDSCAVSHGGAPCGKEAADSRKTGLGGGEGCRNHEATNADGWHHVTHSTPLGYLAPTFHKNGGLHSPPRARAVHCCKLN
jgi:hypothetical protein